MSSNYEAHIHTKYDPVLLSRSQEIIIDGPTCLQKMHLTETNVVPICTEDLVADSNNSLLADYITEVGECEVATLNEGRMET